ncbi:MAG: ComEC/Rec2 family competence protein [Alphaproteobacteria bacterium]
MIKFLKQQFDNFLLWLPLLFSFGATIYFVLPTEPTIPYPILLSCIFGILLFIKHVNIFFKVPIAVLFGFVYTIAFTHCVQTPMLKHDLRDINFTGNIKNIEFHNDKVRYIVEIAPDELDMDTTKPVKVRISGDAKSEINVGDTVNFNAALFQISGPETVGAFDFARWAYFHKITATGYVKDYNIVNKSTNTSFEKTRENVHNKSKSFLTDGLVLGYKNSLSPQDQQIWTTAGVGHVWSISGFHMTLVGGWLIILFYSIFRCIPYITKRIPAKIPAMICAWIGLLVYVLLSGIGVATIRAFIMTSLVFVALFIGRKSFSLRNISIAFLVLFLFNPSFISQAGFQLSFAAIFGIVWFWNNKNNMEKSFLNTIYKTLMTTLIATLFTMPFIISNFNSLPIYGIVGNLILLPIFSILIMPIVIIGTIFALLFNQTFLLNIAEYVYNFSFDIAKFISGLPSANLTFPYINNSAIFFFVFALACLIFIIPIKDSKSFIYKNANLYACIICSVIGIGIIVATDKPVFYATPDHELVGFVFNGKLEFNKAKASNHYFAFDAFRKLNNEKPSETNIRHKCKKGVCIYKSDNFTLAYIQKFVPLQNNIVELCNDDNINYIVSYFDIQSEKCNHKILRDGFVIYKNKHIKYVQKNRIWFSNQPE